MKAYLFSGQGSQFIGMGKNLYKKSNIAKKIFKLSNDILGFNITSIMFNGPKNILQKTENAQLSIYIYSVILSKIDNKFYPDMVAGHSLGEFSALASINVFSFENGLKLVNKRASLMKKICDKIKGCMVAILGLKDNIIEDICNSYGNGVVTPSNYNTPGQLVISGEYNYVKKVCSILKKKGAKKIFYLPVSGAFHSPIMKPIEKKFSSIINKMTFKYPICPIYQNINGIPVKDTFDIKKNLVRQLTNPVKWKQSIKNMYFNGAKEFIEIGEKNILKKMIKRILQL